MASASNQEIELKRLLVGPSAAERLLQALGPVASDVEQVNHVFDTPAHALSRARHSLRLREEGLCFLLTAKGPSAAGGSVSTRAEAEAEIDRALAAQLLAGQGDALGELRQRAVDPAFEPLWAGIERARAGQPLALIGSFQNRRRRVPVELPSGLALCVEVDRTQLPNGRVDDEVEIELPRADLAAEVEAWLEARAASAGLALAPSTAKFARFYAALEAVGAAGEPGPAEGSG